MKTTIRVSVALVALTLSAAATLAGCGAAPESGDVGEAGIGRADQALGACLTIRRGGPGNIVDTKLRGDQPNSNFGSISTFVTGDQFSNRVALMGFDLSPIPAGQSITSAAVALQEYSNLGPSTVDVHAVTAPWQEGTVTWASFGSAYDPVAATSFSNGGAGYKGMVSFDLTALVQGWYGGAPNHGVALLAASNSTWVSSEPMAGYTAPSLRVCYVPDLCYGVTCQAADACHVAGTCDPATGACTNPPAPDGTACDDGNVCSSGDSCQAGVCRGAVPPVLFFSDPCDKPTLGFHSFSETVTITGTGTIDKVWAGIGYWMQSTVYSVTLSTAARTVSYPNLGFSPRMLQGYSPCAPLNNMAGAALPTPFPVSDGEVLTITVTGSGGEIHEDYWNGRVRMGLQGTAACGG